MSSNQQKSMLDCLYYEIWMMNKTFSKLNLLSDRYGRNAVEKNAFLESFLIHTRNLIYFLQDQLRDDDIRCSDFGVGRQTISLPPNNSLDEINKYLTHLTKRRIVDTKPRWYLDEIRKTLNEKVKEFLNQLPENLFPTPEDRRKNDFEILF